MIRTKKGQISTEVLYAVGTMIIIFLLLTGITMNRKLDLKKTEDYLDKRTECLKISNTISSVSASGPGTGRKIDIMHYVTVFRDSRIVVSEEDATPRTVEAICTYTGSTPEDTILAGIAEYGFNNTEGNVTIGQVIPE